MIDFFWALDGAPFLEKMSPVMPHNQITNRTKTANCTFLRTAYSDYGGYHKLTMLILEIPKTERKLNGTDKLAINL
jgi:hypothetical protein